jgi:hypothetical protein
VRQLQLPAEARDELAELAAADAVLAEPEFCWRYGAGGDPEAEVHLRLLYLKYRHRLGYERLRTEVSVRPGWRAFCGLAPGEPVPEAAALMTLANAVGAAALADLPAAVQRAAMLQDASDERNQLLLGERLDATGARLRRLVARARRRR